LGQPNCKLEIEIVLLENSVAAINLKPSTNCKPLVNHFIEISLTVWNSSFAMLLSGQGKEKYFLKFWPLLGKSAKLCTFFRRLEFFLAPFELSGRTLCQLATLCGGRAGCLQERMQKQGRPLPVYSLAQALGADHAKAFVMTVSKSLFSILLFSIASVVLLFYCILKSFTC
jgi:hypothetical protein